jgi:hypothetical protein
MQKILNTDYPNSRIAILGVNRKGLGSNESFCEGRDIPWLQDTADADWRCTWGVTLRDVIILGWNGDRVGVFNLKQHDIIDDVEFEALIDLLIETAEGMP